MDEAECKTCNGHGLVDSKGESYGKLGPPHTTKYFCPIRPCPDCPAGRRIQQARETLPGPTGLSLYRTEYRTTEYKTTSKDLYEWGPPPPPPGGSGTRLRVKNLDPIVPEGYGWELAHVTVNERPSMHYNDMEGRIYWTWKRQT